MLSFVIILLSISICNSETITISTKLGDITGSVQNTSWSTNVYLFAGIRYAAPPLNDLRFRQAQLLNKTYDGTYDATLFGAWCTQPGADNILTKGNITISEDCLFLNIWTSNVKPVGELLPVMFYIHGGAYVSGSGADSSINGNNIIGETNGNFVYVSINYRLGTLGFLQNEAIYNEDPNWKSYGGFNGLYDQITAMKWVKNNIASYGGDPNKITIFGESAGGLSVCYLLVSPMVPTDTFQRAIIESGACNGAWGGASMKDGLNDCNLALEKAGYPINNLTYLRSIDAATFSNTVDCDLGSVDGLVMIDQAQNIYPKLVTNEYHTFNAKDSIIIGWTSVDALAQQYNAFAPSTEKEYTETISKFFPNKTQQNLMENVYYPPATFAPEGKDNEYQMAWYTINSDACLGCPSLLLAKQVLQSKVTNNVYVFEFGGPTSSKTGMSYAPHASELAFVFDWKYDDVSTGVQWSQTLSDSMVSAWTNYGIYGNPNVTNKIDKINIIWNPFGDDQSSMIVWNDTGKIIPSKIYQNGACEFLNNDKGFSVVDLCNAA